MQRTGRDFPVRGRPAFRRGARRAFTLPELLVSIGVGTVISLAVCGLILASFRAFTTEMRQNEVTARCRILISNFSTDAQAASQIVYVGPGPYTPPTLSSGSYTYPKDSNNNNITSMSAVTSMVVFALPSPSSDSTTTIVPNSYDYVGYGWSQAAQTVVRTCIVNSASSRAAESRVVPEGGSYDSSLSMQLHVASSFTNPQGTSYAGGTYAINAQNASNNYLFEGSSPVVGVKNVDQVTLDAVISANSWGLAGRMELKSECKLRNWRQP